MFLNMLIAIMGDAFNNATANKENNATITKVKIMGDYIDLIARDEASNREENEILFVVEPLLHDANDSFYDIK